MVAARGRAKNLSQKSIPQPVICNPQSERSATRNLKSAIGIIIWVLLGVLSWPSLGLTQPLAEITQEVETEFGLYQPYLVDVTPAVPSYIIAGDFSNVSNFKEFAFNEKEEELLRANGFVVKRSEYKQVYDVYNDCKKRGRPIFVTTDALLHTFHILYDYTLRDLEVRQFAPDLKGLTQALLQRTQAQYDEADTGAVKEAALKNLAYFAVAARLLDDSFDIPAAVKDVVESELTLIETHAGFSPSPIFGYKEDYSQYVPRGHYTRNETLQRYFRAMMWYGRITFRIEPSPFEGGAEKGRQETRQAILIVKALSEIAPEEGLDIWDKIYQPTVFFVGKTDDLNIYDYAGLIKEVYGVEPAAPSLNNVADEAKLSIFRLFGVEPAALSLSDLADEAKLTTFIEEAKELRNPLINSSWVWEWEEAQEVTKGFRFMGQRFIPDSYMFTQLVYPKVGTQLLPRLFPKGLDVLSVLGSERAYQILDERYEETKYANYVEQIEKLKTQFADLADTAWAQNLYWNWLYCLMPMLTVKNEGYPPFMQTTAWIDKDLSTALGSWTELRHDTILYAKQSYTGVTAIPALPPLVQGYVEPNPHLFARLAALTALMRTGLGSRDLLLPEFSSRLNDLESLLLRLKEIAEKELTNQTLSLADYELICEIGSTLEDLVTFPPEMAGEFTSEADEEMAVAADVHTDPNSSSCLEEGVGYPHNIFVITRVAGEIKVTRGAVFSYYEFTQPMSDRLTDEAWQELLKSTPPAQPEWMESFIDLSLNPGYSPWQSPSESAGLLTLDISIFPDAPVAGDTIQILVSSNWPLEVEPTVEVISGEGTVHPVEVTIDPVSSRINQDYLGFLNTTGLSPGEILIKATGRQYSYSDPVTYTLEAELAPAGGASDSDTTPPTAFDLLSPANNSQTDNALPTFTWQAGSDTESGIAGYELWIDGTKAKEVAGTSAALDQALSVGRHTWYVKARNGAGLTTSSASFTLTVEAPPVEVITTGLPEAKKGVFYYRRVLANGGSAPYTWSVYSGSLPQGLSLASDGVISGTPQEQGIFDFTLQVMDGASQTVTKGFFLSVRQAQGWEMAVSVMQAQGWEMDFGIPTSTLLSSVTMIGPTDGWAVGVGGTILHWDGASWSEVSSPTSNWLYSVTMTGPTDGWAVGDGSTIFHWDGVSWSEVSLPTSNSLRSVTMTGPTDGWAVGWNGTILHWDGASWSEVSSPTSNDLLSVTMASPTDGWAVGGRGTILHWDGASWSEVSSPTSDWLKSVTMTGPTDGWAVGYGDAILHWDGASWRKVGLPTSDWLESVTMTGPTDGWAVGSGGIILHWDGASWSDFSSPTSNGLYSVTMTGPTNGWAVGEDVAILHWDGASWTEVSSPTSSWLRSVTMTGPTDGWAVGQRGTILHWDGASWSEVSPPTLHWLCSVTMTSSTDGWAVGAGGTILRYVGPQPLPGSILGGITYSGQQTGQIIVQTSTSPTFETITAETQSAIPNPQSAIEYILSLPPGNYYLYLRAFMDTDADHIPGAGPESSEPIGFYGNPDPISVEAGQEASGFDFTISDPFEADLEKVIVYPNPYRPSSNTSQNAPAITFKNLTAQATINIYTINIYNIAGELVKTIEELDADGQATWDGKNEAGHEVRSGIYIYLITSPTGDKTTGKIAIIK
ncbi:MAG: DUF3160 domain-containing protein [bacterium]|nr:DUF3160 domain-containing protein [bacterium]